MSSPEPAPASAELEPTASGPVAHSDELTERAGRFARGARAPATWRAYEGKWRRFQTWCDRAGETACPAAPMTVARFLTDLAPHWREATPADPPADLVDGQILVRDGLRPATLEVYRTAVAVAHRSGAHPDPCASEPVRRVMAGIRRHRGVAPTRRRTALYPADMAAILAVLDPDRRLVDARDAALLLLGWKAALRTDDLHRLDLADLRIDHTPDDAHRGLAVRLRHSKTDQTGQGVTVGITTANTTAKTSERHRPDPLDAVAAWRRWAEALRARGITAGPAWRGIDRYGTRPRAGRLSRNAIAAVVTARAAAAGLDGDYGGHSLRRGFATSALAGGASERAVQHHGRWRSPVSMAPYVDEADRYADDNPTRNLGL